MKLLVSGATTTIRRHINHGNLGQLITPRDRNAPIRGMAYAADNSAYSDWNEPAFMRMLDKIQGYEQKPLFVAVPDFVGNARISSKLFDIWAPEIIDRGLPAAYVLQDGQGGVCVPWGDISALFIGGSTAFKSCDHVRYLVKKANRKGIWVHMGRVNSYQRLQVAMDMGVDSVDGSGYSRFAELKLAKALNYLQMEQGALELNKYLLVA
ncbi:hypothetical protein FY034_17625 (plasmid) [Trichlorobacter lovleyi]|uniref:hypothetical protein n=1 Tax=Trichlorobacter lovleyi TaxID=313985 RepID=UPI00223F7FDE|nr:hypothetical protein [Trichlorobacter lovleyi]QOX80844.1 hypothetical protein FY034_17625 [Trichlorobacter lovleyi]